MRTHRRLLVAALAGTTFVAACTSSTNEGTTTTAETAAPDTTGPDPTAPDTTGPDSTQPPDTGAPATSEPAAPGDVTVDAEGITDDAIRISLIYSDLSVLSEQNLAPEIGNAQQMLEAVVADVNERGGVLDRRIELVPHVIAGAEAAINPDAGRQACLRATDDDRPFAIIITAAISAATVECTIRHEGALTITMDSWPASYFESSAGRLFSISTHLAVSRQRVYRSWPRLLDEQGVLEGRTIGIVRTDTPDQEESVNEGLVPGLEDLGYEVAAISVLPCPEGSLTGGCQQHDVAIQRLRSAGVDFVFLVAQTLAGSATVEAAADLGFTTEWATIGNNVTDTVAQFFANARESYDGAWGIDANFLEPTPEAVSCNDLAVARGAEVFEYATDGYFYTAVTCLQLLTLIDALETAAATGSVTQASVIAALEAMDEIPVSAGPPGSLGATKHDAGDYAFLSRYDAETQTFIPVDGAEPLRID